ncbi:glycosyltransferase family 4 protein [Virgibacillus oceani]
MKNICFVTTTSITIKSFLLGQLNYLSKNGYNITVICDYCDSLKNHLPKNINYIPVNMKRGIDFNTPKSILALYKVFRNGNFNIVQYSTPNAAFNASIAARLAGVPIRIYAQWGIRYVGYNGWKRKIFKLLERLVCTLSTRIQPDSKGNLIYSHKEGLYIHEKSNVIWNGSANGVDLNKFDILKKEAWRTGIRNRYNIGANDLVLGFIGRLDKDKGVNELLEAFKIILHKHPGLKLLMIGPSDKDDGLNQGLLAWSKQSESVIFTGFIEGIEKYMSAIDILVQPSYREGFGSVVIEAEAMGIPVIVTDIPGPTDAMQSGSNATGLIVPKKAVQPLVQAMEKMVLDPELREEMSQNAISFARSHFDQAKLLNFILEDKNRLYHQLISSKEEKMNA